MKAVGHIPNKLPGRHRCECQARIHPLVRNCLGCGRIVCEQEGSGPCVFCEKLVCSKAEENIIKTDLKRGVLLEKELLKKAGYGSDLSRTKQQEEAQKYRDQLLKADRESVVRNRVLDLDSDYYNVENGHYLTAEERKAIQKRKEELHRTRMNRAGRSMMMNLDFASRSVTEVKTDNNIESVEDGVISGILRRAEARREREKHQEVYKNRSEDLPNIDNFHPVYEHNHSNLKPSKPVVYSNAVFMDTDQAYADCERKGYCLTLSPEIAYEIMEGKRWFLPYHNEINVQGPICISAGVPINAILGKITLANCVTGPEFKDENPEISSHNPIKDNEFVLIFEDSDQFSTTIPYVHQEEFHQIPQQLREAINQH